MDFQKINHSSLYKDVLLQLENFIKSNGLKPNDKLPPERVIAEQLGISRGTLREAFRVLETNGVIAVTPGGGRTLKSDVSQSNLIIDLINEFEYADALALMELREILEQRIVELVVERATDDELVEIERSLSRGNDLYELDNIFHLALAKASHNPAFYNVMYLNLSQLAKIRMRSLGRLEREKKMPLEHQHLLDAIMKRDLKQAKKMLAAHLAAVRLSMEKEKEYR